MTAKSVAQRSSAYQPGSGSFPITAAPASLSRVLAQRFCLTDGSVMPLVNPSSLSAGWLMRLSQNHLC
jgi:hypothetical protein